MKQQLALYWHRPGTDRRLVSSSVVSNVDMAYTNEYSTLLKIEQVEDDCYYDFHVPGFNNYWAQGVWHHNCGKSVLAMAIAQSFGFPLFKLDIGKLFGSKVGESEGNVRELIRLLESLGRAVILVDEIEKSLNTNAASGQGDSGTGSRVFGTLISWMALKKCPIFIVGTANNIDALPPELIRKGRFDEIWWVDLPSAEERVDIFNKLLQHKFKRELRIKDVDDPMITESKDFSGAEIESVIEDALYEMLEPGQKYTLGLLVEKVLSKTVPQARINPEYIDSMRKKAASGYRMANDHVETAKIPATRNITL